MTALAVQTIAVSVLFMVLAALAPHTAIILVPVYLFVVCALHIRIGRHREEAG